MIEFIEHVEGIIVSKVSLLKDFYALIKLEARLAGMNVIPLMICCALMFALITGFGLTLISLTGYILFLLTDNLMIVMSLLLLIMIIGMFFVARVALGCIRQMSFERTRECFAASRSGEQHVKEKAASGINRQHRSQNSVQSD